MFAYVRRCSPMFAYVRLCSLNARKMFEAPDGERSSILQIARQTEMASRGTRPSEYQRQRLARRCLDFGRARWVRRNAEPMNGKAKGLSNVTLVSFVTLMNADRGFGKIFAYLRLMGKKCCGRCARPLCGMGKAEKLN